MISVESIWPRFRAYPLLIVRAFRVSKSSILCFMRTNCFTSVPLKIARFQPPWNGKSYLPPRLVTIKCTKDSRVMLRLLAAYGGTDIVAVAEQVLHREVRRKKIDVPGIVKQLSRRKGQAK